MNSHLHVAASAGFFEAVVAQTVDFLKLSWPEDLAALSFRILDSPVSNQDVASVPRYSVNRKLFQITIFRIPIERLTHHRRTDRLDERFHIEQFVFQAVAELLDKDPGDLIPENFRR